MRKFALLFVVFLFSFLMNTHLNAQSVGIGTTQFIPNSKSILELQGNGLGLLIPRMTWAQRPQSLDASHNGPVRARL